MASPRDEEILESPEVRLRAALTAAARDVRPRLVASFGEWRGVPGLEGLPGLVQQRLGRRARDRRRSVPPVRSITAWMGERFSSFALDLDTGEFLRFTRLVADDTLLVISWSVNLHFGLGPFLALAVGLRNPSAPWAYDQADLVRPLAYYFGRSDLGSWTLDTAEDLRSALESAGPVLDLLVPALTTATAGHLADAALTTGLGPLSAREAVAHARAHVDGWDPSARLVEATAAGAAFDRWGGGITAEGRLRPHGVWNLRFVSPATTCPTAVSVPFAGAMDVLPFDEPQPWLETAPIGDRWIDSTEAVPLAAADSEVAGAGSLMVPGGAILRAPDRLRPNPWWQISLVAADDPQRGTSVLIDAVTGEALAPPE